MKIIGIDESGNYIAVVTKTEVQKVCDKYYANMPDLKVGKEFDLGTGYDFRADIKSACELMTSASDRFGRSQKVLFAFAQMVSKLQGAEAGLAGKETV